MKKDRLYKKDSKGKIRVLDIEIEGNGFRTISGLEDGKLVTSAWTVCTPKNIGKINETTSEEQAILEGTAAYDKKLREHYVLDREEAEEGDGNYFKVMLAVDKDKVKGFPPFPYIADYKLDGMRFTTSSEGGCSRKGTKVPAAEHIEELMKAELRLTPDLTFDGEIYNHKLKSNFEYLMHLSRSQSFTPDEKKECISMLEYHIYDMDSSTEEIAAWQRKEIIEMFVERMKHPYLQLVHSETVNNQAELDAFEEKALSLGYEGVILRSPTEPYLHTRTKYLIKVKRFITEEFIIIGVLEGEGNNAGMAGKIVIRKPSGAEVECGLRASHEKRKLMLISAKDLIGKQATIRHFGCTPKDSLRFPVCIDINRKE